MSTVNYNDTVPAAPANYNNIKWQSDTSGNISAYDPGGTWTTWTPSFGGGSMTVTIKTLTDAQYLRSGPLVFFKLNVEVLTSGTASANIAAIPPIPWVGQSSACTLLILNTAGGGWAPGIGYINNNFQIGLSGGATFASPGDYMLQMAGFYRCA